jgi:hypothetical protein
MGIEEGPVLFQMTAKVMVQELQTTLGICTVNIYMVVGVLSDKTAMILKDLEKLGNMK